MKKIIRKFWGVALIVILLSTLFVGGTVQTANAATLSWSKLSTPDTLGYTNQILPSTLGGLSPSHLVVASDGTLFCIGSVPNNFAVYKSTTKGLSWTLSANISTSTDLVDLAVSPSYATDATVFALGTYGGSPQVYISTNAGATFSVLGGTCGSGTGYSLAVSPTYNASGEVMVGTSSGVYIWGRGGVQNWDAATSPLTTKTTKVAYSPNFALDQTRFAITNNGTATVLSSLVASDPTWDRTLYDLSTQGTATTINSNTGGSLTSSTIAFPSDFNASSQFYRTLYIALYSSTNASVNHVYRLTDAYAAGETDLGPPTYYAAYLGGAFPVSSLAYSGTTASGTLFAGLATQPWVLYTTSPTGTAAAVPSTWYGGTNSPSGASSTYVALSPNFTSDATVYASTGGKESAVSVSTDSGNNYAQAGLINTTVSSITAFQAADSSNLYMVTNCNNGTDNTSSVWKTTDAGATWYRVLAAGSPSTHYYDGTLQLSPNYATDKTVVFGLVTDPYTSNLEVSNNAGTSWTAKSTPQGGSSSSINNGFSQIVVKDQYTFYIGDNNGDRVQVTTNGGWTWAASATVVLAGGPKISSLSIDLASGALLAADSNGKVFISTDNNATWTQVGSTAPGTIAAFDAKYSTNGFMYAIGAAGALYGFGTGFGDWRAYSGTGISLYPYASSVNSTNGAVNDLLSAADGTLYAPNSITGAAMLRSLNPSGLYASGVDTSEWVNASYLYTGATPSILATCGCANTIYAVDNTNLKVFIYTDTLTPATATSMPALTSPADGTVYAATNNIYVSWGAVAGAYGYQVQWDTRNDFQSYGSQGGIASVAAPVTSYVITTAKSGKLYYWRVRVNSQTLGPWATYQTFSTELTATQNNSPSVAAGAEGTTGPGGWNVTLTPSFSWGNVYGATGFEFILATDAAMTNKVVDLEGTNALGAVQSYAVTTPLSYSTTYYWKVRGISGSSYTDWTTVFAFTTMSKPTTSAPAVTVTQQAAPTITIPQATSTQLVITQPATKEINPSYIWAIIIIGAVLVLAVIVLIIRTRRSV